MGDNLPAVNLGSGRNATALASGNGRSCALLDDGTIKCWGANPSGQLGLGDTSARGNDPGEMGDNLPALALGTSRTAVAITAGGFFGCALLDDATVKCWGDGGSGQLGQGDTVDRGDGPGEMGDNLLAVDLGTGRTALAISAGNGDVCALLDNGTVKCWGYNYWGGLGLGDRGPRGDGPGEMGDNLPAVALGTGRTALAISAGGGHTCALLDNATVKCWGRNDKGQLGLGDTADRGDGSGEMGDNLPAVDLGAGRTATAITAGGSHTCALLDNGTIKCWGGSDDGKLGLGDTADRGDQTNEMGDNLPAVALGTGRTVTAVTAGDEHTCARLDNGTIKCWGRNYWGGLGLGDRDSRGDDPGEMGDNLPVVDLVHTGVSGKVTETGSGTPVRGAWVAVLRTADFSLAGGAIADNSGDYSAEVPAGSYYLYVIDPRYVGDPTGGHAAGFFGAPTTVPVVVEHFTNADPSMVPTRGSVNGTVAQDGTGTPIAGAWAVALNGSTGAPETGVVANGSGQFTLPGLHPGNHYVGYFDPTGAHATRFYPNSPNVPDATPVPVTGGGTTIANGSLPAQTATPGGALLTGLITETGTANPLPGVFVMALHASSYQLARATVTNAAGRYTLNVQAGAYKLAFIDSTGLHDMEWHSNQPANGLAGAVSVTAPAATNAALDPNTGTMAGTITDDPTGAPIAGAWVLAIGPTGVTGGAVTDTDGTYTLPTLPPGTYRAAIIDPTGDHTLEYIDDSPTYAGAAAFAVAASDTTVIDAALAHP